MVKKGVSSILNIGDLSPTFGSSQTEGVNTKVSLQDL